MSNSNELFNLKLTDIPGKNAQEILATYIKELDSFIKHCSLDENSKLLYSTYLRGLEYYQYISNPRGKFLHNSLKYVNSQYKILSNKYKNLSVEGRVKSLLSSDEKIKNKICEYIRDNRDLKDLNFSLRDFVAFRFILKDSKKTTEKKEVKKCYKLLRDHINLCEKSGFTLIPVRAERLDAIRKQQIYTHNPNEVNIFIPNKKSKYFHKRFTPFVKDYIRYPKKTLYQSLHYCANLPKPNFYNYPATLEFQFRTENMHHNAEKGIFSHDAIYKKNNIFHILNVPTFIRLNNNDELQCLSFDKNLKIKYGQFEDLYNIPYKIFKRVFSVQEQKQILEGTHMPVLNENTARWEARELNYLPWLDYKKYKINHTEAQRKFKQAISKEHYFQKEL